MKQVFEYFEDIDDPRVERAKLHSLSDILGITLCATIAGATGWDGIKDFATERVKWLKSFLNLEHGIPSADTIRRVISRVEPKEFHVGFVNWVSDITAAIDGVVSIDGKTIKNKYSQNPLHLVSAWTEANNGLCLGQVAADEKSNEITAIPNLLEYLDIKGCIVTIDAMGCQKKIVEKISQENEADFCIAVKRNQPTLHKEIKDYFSECDGSAVNGATRFVTVEKSRGREERRTAYLCKKPEYIDALAEWLSVKTFGLIINETAHPDGKVTSDRRYYISSASLSAKSFLTTVRSHWSIENQLHWVLGVSFNEDGNRIENNAQQNLATTRKIALNLLREETTNLSVKRKIFKSALSTEFMSKVLKIS